ncbi:cytoplasmic protein [Clostridium intestinale]|uniref:cytoplasmic protein n=1 Tax=Clostridium intestinale TaxID=36845 RepID=UPI0028EDFAAA|nr:cytoplasmic protein [Clostridium intestinale]
MLIKPIVEKIDILFKSEVLFKVTNGQDKIKIKYVKDINNNIKVAYYLNDTPLILYNSEYCPTCATMIALAEGREEVDEEIIKILDKINNIHGVEDGFDKIKSILGLLDDGYYVLKEIEFYPTDGDDNFFWTLDNKANHIAASAYFYHREYGTIVPEPKFLIPSQGTNVYNKDRVEYYRSKIRNNEVLYGLAIEFRGALGLLLDGHHKATASYLEGKPIKCLTIMQVFQYKNYNTKETGISYGRNNVKYSEIRGSEDIIKFYDKKMKIKEEVVYEEVYLEDKYYKPINIDKSKVKFPSYEYYALSNIAEDVSEEKIKELLRYRSIDNCDELREIFYNLRVNNEERARNLSLSILNSDKFNMLWEECIYFLSQYKDDEIQDLFINLLIEYDSYTFGYDAIRDIIDNYFREI